MGYDYEDFIDAMRFGLTMSDRDTTDDIWNMVDEVVNKAKAWDKYLESTVRQEAIDEFGEDDPRVDYAVELTERLYREDK
ncbi:hypothetical protein K1Y24_01950 [Mammaliicoccus sciuri]|uniref:hypothetical protein n=1 Tax=Mammaliicoccus sciuri TaxID=1296 RepID=UPI001E6083A7|nr:hypothetical protein [Mammaliicoccus sciuri]MCD8800717.1 hypothetical protein [Mammaliicoccus sciuri]